MPIQLPNALARRVFLDRHSLLSAPSGSGKGDELAAQITALGFVQIDSVNTLARAHDLILWGRSGRYRPKALEQLLDPGRAVFEDWTHDAAAIPMAFYPHWRHRFEDNKTRMANRWKTANRDRNFESVAVVRDWIGKNGACNSADLDDGGARGSSGWWDWAPSKTALEYLWRTGELAVVRRVGFRKIYDLAERVIPADLRAQEPDLATSLDWACMGALARLGFGTSGEIAAFWELFNPAQVRTWCADALAAGRVEQVDVIDVDGRARASFALPGLLEQAALLPAPVNRMRLLSPFDPMLRDRARAERLFGFHYRIEIYVPEPKRKYGYYVFPLMEGDQMVGRIDMKAERGAGRLAVRALWPEQGVGFGKGRVARLEAELERAARLSGLDHVSYAADWLRLS